MLVIKHAKVFTATSDEFIDDCDILIDDGKIKEIGRNISVDNREVLDASGLVVLPGLVDAHSHVGGFGVSRTSPDLNEMTSPSTPSVEAIYGVDTDSVDFQRVIEAGITTSIITPGSGNVICGTAFAVKSVGENISDMCIKNPVAMKAALGGNPKGVYGKKNQLPMTRMGVADVIRKTLVDGQKYLDKKEKNSEDFKFDMGMENISKVLKKEIPLKVHCEQIDMLTVISIAKEFDIQFTLEHAWGASNYIKEISNSGVKGINFGPIGIHMTPGECGIVDIESVCELTKNGVVCSLITDGPLFTPFGLVLQAGELVRFGMKVTQALKTITINPAIICDISDRVGSIEIGKDADLAIFSHIPALETSANLLYTVIDGKIIYKW
ncbi:MAG: amidohydrolase family protein [Oscillospiraceae bacterium]